MLVLFAIVCDTAVLTSCCGFSYFELALCLLYPLLAMIVAADVPSRVQCCTPPLQNVPASSSQIHTSMPDLTSVAYSSRFAAVQVSSGSLARKSELGEGNKSTPPTGEVFMCNFEHGEQWKDFVQQDAIK